MKIEGGYTILEPGKQTRSNQQGQSQGTVAFSDVLAQAVSEQSSAAQGVDPVQTVSAPSEATLEPGQAQLWQQTNGLVETLENYGQALGDPSKTLKDIQPLADKMETQAQAVGASLQAGGSSNLHSLAWQAVTQAQVEAIKFRRGDYV